MLAVETKRVTRDKGVSLKEGGYEQGFLPLDRGCFFIYARSFCFRKSDAAI